MAQQQYRNPNAAPRNALSEFKLRLIAPPQQGSTKKAVLEVGIFKNNPRLVVRTNVPNDKDYGKITAAMDSFTFFALLETIREVAAAEGEVKRPILNMSTFVAGRKMDSPVNVSKTIVGKDKQGVVYLSVVAKDRPMIKFPFQDASAEWHHLVKEDGTRLTEAEASVIYAKAWCNLFQQLVPLVLYHEYVEPELPNNGGNRQAGNNNSGGENRSNQGGGSSAKPSEDDDLPF